MKTSDIPERPILEFLAKHQGEWCNWFTLAQVGADGYGRSVMSAMPEGTPEKLALSKMRSLIKHKLVTGCVCGCRGDFEITDKGLEAIKAEREQPIIMPTTPKEEQDTVADMIRRGVVMFTKE